MDGSVGINIRNDYNRIRVALTIINEKISSSGTIQKISVYQKNTGLSVEFEIDVNAEGWQFFSSLENICDGSFNAKATTSTREQHLQSLYIIFDDCNVQFSNNFQEKIGLFFPLSDTLSNNLRILIVDDDQVLRETLVALLSIDGHYIITANSAEEAQELLNDDIDLMLLDINLPKMSGLDLLKQLSQTHPEWTNKIILISGLINFEVPDQVRFLQKPFSKQRLTELLYK